MGRKADMGMEARNEIPEVCPVCDARLFHYEGGNDKEHSGYWNHMARFDCGSVLAIHGHKSHKVTVDTHCPEAQRLAVKYREGWAGADEEIKGLKDEVAKARESCLHYQSKVNEQVDNRKARMALTKRLPKNHGQPWLKVEQARLRNEHKQGLTVQEIAEFHDRTLGAIYSALRRIGIYKPKWEPGTGPDANWRKK